MAVKRGLHEIEENGETRQTSYIRVLALNGKAAGNVPDEWRGRKVEVETYVPSADATGHKHTPADVWPDIGGGVLPPLYLKRRWPFTFARRGELGRRRPVRGTSVSPAHR